jgi:hypothetical protein
MKFARLVATPDAGKFSVTDLFTTDPADDSTPMKIPSDAQDPEAWLRHMFSGFISQWDAEHEQFQIVPDGVRSSCFFFW